MYNRKNKSYLDLFLKFGRECIVEDGHLPLCNLFVEAIVQFHAFGELGGEIFYDCA